MFFGDAARLAELLEHCVFFGVYFVGQDKSILTTQMINKIHHKINGKVLASSQHLWAIPGCKVSKSVIIGKISKRWVYLDYCHDGVTKVAINICNKITMYF